MLSPAMSVSLHGCAGYTGSGTLSLGTEHVGGSEYGCQFLSREALRSDQKGQEPMQRLLPSPEGRNMGLRYVAGVSELGPSLRQFSLILHSIACSPERRRDVSKVIS